MGIGACRSPGVPRLGAYVCNSVHAKAACVFECIWTLRTRQATSKPSELLLKPTPGPKHTFGPVPGTIKAERGVPSALQEEILFSPIRRPNHGVQPRPPRGLRIEGSLQSGFVLTLVPNRDGGAPER